MQDKHSPIESYISPVLAVPCVSLLRDSKLLSSQLWSQTCSIWDAWGLAGNICSQTLPSIVQVSLIKLHGRVWGLQFQQGFSVLWAVSVLGCVSLTSFFLSAYFVAQCKKGLFFTFKALLFSTQELSLYVLLIHWNFTFVRGSCRTCEL